jgi:hypothetical protein
MAPNTAALATAISNLVVTGVTFKDVSGIPKVVKDTDCPIFFPHPDEWFASMQTDPQIKMIGIAGQFDVTRTLRYIYLHRVSIAANTMASNYASMAANVDLIYSEIGKMNNYAASVVSISISRFGEIQAPQSGQVRNVFFGCFFDINFMEIVNR